MITDNTKKELTPLVIECFSDNGEHSHWSLVNTETGETIISEEQTASMAEELERMKAALKFTKKKIDSFECECDDYNGFTCGIHEWRDKVNHALKSENNESNNNGREE